MSRWTEKELLLAKDLLGKGCTFAEISITLDRSYGSVKNKLNKLGLKSNDINPRRENRICENCGSSFETTLSSDKRFCSKSCSVSFTNKLRKKQDFGNCKNCNKSLNKKEKVFCDNNCQHDFYRKKKFKEIEEGTLLTDDSRIYKKYLIHKHGEECMKCGWSERNPFSNKIPLELHHIDSNPDNNKADNLQLLCPNCHSLSDYWRGMKNNGGRYSRRRIKRRKRYHDGKSC